MSVLAETLVVGSLYTTSVLAEKAFVQALVIGNLYQSTSVLAEMASVLVVGSLYSGI